MLEDKDLKFAGQQLEGCIGVSAGFGTVGGGVIVVRKKCYVRELVVLVMQIFEKKAILRMEYVRIHKQLSQGFFLHHLH
jgi:hypothetical protein